MKNYTEPKLEIVAIDVADVITTSLRSLFSGVRNNGIEYGGHSDLKDYSIESIQ